MPSRGRLARLPGATPLVFWRRGSRGKQSKRLIHWNSGANAGRPKRRKTSAAGNVWKALIERFSGSMGVKSGRKPHPVTGPFRLLQNKRIPPNHKTGREGSEGEFQGQLDDATGSGGLNEAEV